MPIKKTKFNNVFTRTEPSTAGAVTSRDDAFPPPYESTTNINGNETNSPQSDDTSQLFLTGVAMFSDSPYKLINDS